MMDLDVERLKRTLSQLGCGDAACLIPSLGRPAPPTTRSGCRCVGAIGTVWMPGQRHRIRLTIELLAKLVSTLEGTDEAQGKAKSRGGSE